MCGEILLYIGHGLANAATLFAAGLFVTRTQRRIIDNKERQYAYDGYRQLRTPVGEHQEGGKRANHREGLIESLIGNLRKRGLHIVQVIVQASHQVADLSFEIEVMR